MLYRRGHAQQHVDVVRHCLTLHQLDILLAAQVPKDLPDASSYPSVQHLATVLREDYDVILAVPLHVGLTLPILQGGPPAPRGLPHGGPSHVHARDGRAFRSLTAKGGGFAFDSTVVSEVPRWLFVKARLTSWHSGYNPLRYLSPSEPPLAAPGARGLLGAQETGITTVVGASVPMLVSLVMRRRDQPHSPRHDPYHSRTIRLTAGRPSSGDQ